MAVACGCRSSVTTTSTDGPKVFATYCSACHGPRGQPPAAMVARLKVRDLTAPEFRARVTPELLTDAQIESVAAWVSDPAFTK
jgi:mono/diheme cytochrome c family protein